ncbi:MAG: class I SAM-dependent methyltransferase [Bacteroidales bacterium]
MSDNIKVFFDQMAPQWDQVCKYDMDRIDKILSLVKVKKNDRIVDVACGTGILTQSLLEREVAQVIAIDLSERMIEKAKSKIQHPDVYFEAIDFLTFDQTGFDHVILHNAYPHFLDKEALVCAISRALKPGGRFVIAHSDGRDTINRCHHKLDVAISEKLRPVEVEAEHFEHSFDIDIAIDEPDLYVLSGTRKPRWFFNILS